MKVIRDSTLALKPAKHGLGGPLLFASDCEVSMPPASVSGRCQFVLMPIDGSRVKLVWTAQDGGGEVVLAEQRQHSVFACDGRYVTDFATPVQERPVLEVKEEEDAGSSPTD